MKELSEVERLKDALAFAERQLKIARGAWTMYMHAFGAAMDVALKQSKMYYSSSGRSLCTPDHIAHQDYFQFVPLHSDDAVLMLSRARELFTTWQPSFLDVGCGLGNIVLLAMDLFDSYGIEFSEQYVKAARKILRTMSPNENSGKHIIHADALEYNDYGNYDVIYYFCPIRNRDKMDQLTGRILTQMRIGSVLIAVNHVNFFYRGGVHPIASHPSLECIDRGRGLIMRKKGEL